jgi:hypothetical protein
MLMRPGRPGGTTGWVTALAVSTVLTAAVAVPMAIRAGTADTDEVALSDLIETGDSRFPDGLGLRESMLLAQGDEGEAAPSEPPIILPPGSGDSGPAGPNGVSDLSVTWIDPIPLEIGQLARLPVSLANAGPADSAGVELRIFVAGARLELVSISGWICNGGDMEWFCTREAWVADAGAEAMVELSPTDTALELGASIRSSMVDEHLSDNSSTITPTAT